MGKPGNMIPLDHYSRVKKEIKQRVEIFHREFKKTQEAGKIAADYSLGFGNAMIFFDHILNKRPGEAQFYNRTTSVGSLPKPIALNSGDLTKDTTTYQVLMDHVLVHARKFFETGNQGLDPTEQLALLEKSIQELDHFTQGDRDGRHEHGDGAVSGPDQQHPE